MQRTLFEPEHDAFRDMVRAFMERSVAARHAEWEKAGIVDRDVWLEAGKQGMLGMDVPEEYGGGGVADFRYNAVLDEEIIRIGATGLGFGLHNDIVAPYLLALTTEEQKQPLAARLLLRRADHRDRDERAGRRLRPAAACSTHAPPGRRRLGAVTGPRRSSPTASTPTWCWWSPAPTRTRTAPAASACSRSSAACPASSAAATSTRSGMKAQDTAELFFDEVRVPAANLVGEENRGFVHLMENLPQERLSIAVGRGRGLRGGARADPRLRKEPAGVRPADRLLPAQPVPARRDGHRDRPSPAPTWTSACASTRGRAHRQDAAMAKWWTPSCRTRSSTAACSCTAATAT